ncbi:complex I intermediate-associated protein 30, mitochondrial-like [Styela clava]|uniref:complex I intermediate-associated protein 30, mitochondrial-like n=1 Tax=Styela clava TaxID=7725 RepID=UPI001939D20F|nr:complex I intermediate-associated protein 30, mitochondrial-like [Styela clava]
MSKSRGLFQQCYQMFQKSSLSKGCITTSISSQIHVRMKTNDSSSKDIVIEKEKKHRSYTHPGLQWDNVAVKLAEIRQVMEEGVKSNRESRGRSKYFRDDEILYYFRERDDLEHWYTVTDKELGGKSWAEFVQGDNGMTAAFRGYISQKLPKVMMPSAHDKLEMKQNYRGFALLETKPFVNVSGLPDFLNISTFNCFEIRLRGDGRRYLFEINCEGPYMGFDVIYLTPIHTRGGPEWQTIKLPYGKFIASKSSMYLMQQSPLSQNNVSSFRFLLLDDIQGPFQLEIDYIAMKRDSTEISSDMISEYHDPFTGTNKSVGTW